MRNRLLSGALLLGGVALGGCAAATLSAPVGEPLADPSAIAAEVRAASLPDRPRQINFAWTLDERGSRVRGRGVVRVEAPERIRLDLFGPRGETYLVAALVDGEYRLPASIASGAPPLPSSSLLWAALGILDPPRGGTLTVGTETPAGIALRYEAGGETFAYTFESFPDQDTRLLRLERAGRQGVVETVSLEREPSGTITRARYRDWSNFRDLTLDIETVRESDPFPTTIWRPDAVSQ